jgi:hypothetical protein
MYMQQQAHRLQHMYQRAWETAAVHRITLAVPEQQLLAAAKTCTSKLPIHDKQATYFLTVGAVINSSNY